MSLIWGLCIIIFLAPIAIYKLVETEQTFEQCSKQFKTGKDFNLDQLTGDWYPVYYWPKEFAPKECYKVKFEEVAHTDTEPCRDKIPEGEKIIQATFTTQHKTLTQYFYGAGELKHFSLDVDRGRECELLDGMWRDLGNGYTLVTVCNSGSNTLLTRNLTSSSELQSIIGSIDTLKDTEGGSSCV